MRKPATLNPELLQSFAGTYLTPANVKFQVSYQPGAGASAAGNADLELCVRAAERYGTRDWLLAYVNRHAQSENPGLQARAMTIAGYCAVETDLSNVFHAPRGTGFLNEVATFALKNRTRALWAKHWCEAAICSTDAASFWSYGKLAEGVVDVRFTEYFENLLPSELVDMFGTELYERLS